MGLKHRRGQLAGRSEMLHGRVVVDSFEGALTVLSTLVSADQGLEGGGEGASGLGPNVAMHSPSATEARRTSARPSSSSSASSAAKASAKSLRAGSQSASDRSSSADAVAGSKTGKATAMGADLPLPVISILALDNRLGETRSTPSLEAFTR